MFKNHIYIIHTYIQSDDGGRDVECHSRVSKVVKQIIPTAFSSFYSSFHKSPGVYVMYVYICMYVCVRIKVCMYFNAFMYVCMYMHG